MILNNEKEKLFITFQPASICKNINTSLLSENKFLSEYEQFLGYNPIFCNLIQDNPIEYIISDVLLSFPRNPGVAIVFKKDINEVDVIPRLDVFRYDNLLDNDSNSGTTLSWSTDTKNILRKNYKGDTLNDYLVSHINPNEILGIYIVSKDVNAINYDSLYRYEHLDYMQWVIECLTQVIYGFDNIVDINKVPLIDTESVDFMNVIQTIYNQLIYKPNNINDADFMKFENILELWLYDTVNLKSSSYQQSLQSMYNNIDSSVSNNELKISYKENKTGILNELGFHGSDIAPFMGMEMCTSAVGYKY